MKTISISNLKALAIIVFILSSFNYPVQGFVLQNNLQDTLGFNQFKGKIEDSKSKKALSFATISLRNTNISTVSNSEGEFSIKVPKDQLSEELIISFLGYKNKSVPLRELNPESNIILLEPFNISLGEVVVSANDAELLIQNVLSRIEQNYSSDLKLMTAFYRETVKKRKNYVSLSESVIEIEKQPYSNSADDFIKLFKGRKHTDVNMLDTLEFKLQGGPYGAVYLDIMKYPSIIFTDNPIAAYQFNLENNTQIGERKVFVLSFKQRPGITEPLYYGKLYIDTESLAVIRATFNLNVENRKAISTMIVKKKPIGSEVFPTLASYQINYRESGGKWIFAYSRADLIFRVNWAKKLFNSTFDSTVELAITDWKQVDSDPKKNTLRLRENVIMIDKVSSFTDLDFWGEYNIIEPEKSIETAIKKIQKKM